MQYAEHDHLERNHQGLENELIEDRRDELNIDGSVECRERLGGVLKHYDRRAA
jgi:putative transposase